MNGPTTKYEQKIRHNVDRRIERCRKRDHVSLADLEHTKNDVHELLAETKRLHEALTDQERTTRSKALRRAYLVVDAALVAEPEHQRALALHEVLLKLATLFECTCARSSGLHEKSCLRYVPGHELLSPDNALRAYRAERATTR